MSTSYTPPYVEIGRTFSALRLSGASLGRACAELGVPAARGRRLEALFRTPHPGQSCDSARPRFARCAEHVAAVAALGGYPVLTR